MARCRQSSHTPDNGRVADKRDLTKWMVFEASADAKSGEVLELKFLNMGSAPANPFSRPLAALKWRNLVRDGGRWDSKDEIERKFPGRKTKLGENWHEYSTTGNMIYGFNGAAAGFSLWELCYGASSAQFMDDIKSDDPKDNVGPVWLSVFDQETDYYAVRFGYLLYAEYGADATEPEFRTFLTEYKYADRLAVVEPPSDFQKRSSEWPYGAGHFDNPGNR